MNPALLTHPNIPKPLHGLNPRTLLGQEWWDERRHAAYAKEIYHCWACGVHKSNALYHRWLEGHETYNIDYEHGRAEMIEVVALCHACHNFIHSGRLVAEWRVKHISQDKALTILRHGFDVLEAAHLEAFWVAHASYAEISGIRSHELLGYGRDIKMQVPWADWRLVMLGNEYEPLHKSFEEWQAFYARQSA